MIFMNYVSTSAVITPAGIASPKVGSPPSCCPPLHLFTPSSIHFPPFPSLPLLHSSPSSLFSPFIPSPSIPSPLHPFIPSPSTSSPSTSSLFHPFILYLLTESPNWHHGGIEKAILCQDCRLYFQRYGCMKPLKGV